MKIDTHARHKKFAYLFVKTGNRTDSYINAGYKVNRVVAQAASSRLLRNVMVRRMVDEIRAEIFRKLQIDAEKVISEMKCVGFSNLKNVCSWRKKTLEIKSSDELDDLFAAGLQSISQSSSKSGRIMWTIKMHDKVKALDKLGQHLKLWDGDDGSEREIRIEVLDARSKKT